MVKVLGTVAAAIAIVSIAAARFAPAHDIEACGPPPSYIEDSVHGSDMIAIVSVLDVDDGIIRHPTLPPTASATIDSPASSTPTGRSNVFTTPSPTSSPPPVPTRVLDVDLRGIGARVLVEQVIVGNASGVLDVDGAKRDAVERDIRYWEANPSVQSVCPPGTGIPRFSTGKRYIAMFGDTPVGYQTFLLLPLDGNVLPNVSGFPVELGTYQRHFAVLPTEISSPDADGRTLVRVQGQIPIQQVIAAIQDVHGGSNAVTPPNTGIAGLKATR